MLSFFKRLRGKWSEVPYAREIAVTLIRDGFDPKILEDMTTLGAFGEQSRIFTFLEQRRLTPHEAASAIRLATQRYFETRLYAEKLGWPLKGEKPKEYLPHEAYFLELLGEAAERPPGT